MATVYIGIGSNMGERERNCRRAVEMLGEKGIRVVKMSSAYETAPWGVEDQPGYMNMAVMASTDLGPHELLSALKDIEKRMGRAGTARWGPRVIDLDILIYGDLVEEGPRLTIPHPRMHERGFVLRPLNEIAPGAVHPSLGKTIEDLYKMLPG
jgi:2-amino-4-hydroxy-6-hydroxymethyldihydropteridine diphosphokinase